jgi:methyl-accepting chemotaxis protein
MNRKFRGTGYKQTLPWVFSSFAIWVVLLLITAPVLTITMMLSGIVPDYFHGEIWFFLLTRMPIIAVAGIALAIFTSVRASGPLVKLGRAFDDVASGNMDCRVRFRRGDKAFRGIETSFNEMMEALHKRMNSPAAPGLEAEGAAPAQADASAEESYVNPEQILLGD